MAKTIKEYVSENEALWDSVGTSVDELVTGLEGLTGDVTFLKDTIVKLQNNPGPISAEDQALLDAGVPRGNAAVEKFKAFAAALKALDESTAKDEAPTPPTPA